MKSRVNKNSDLHQTLSMSFEPEAPSKDLSHYANRLNEIDEQFRRVDVSVTDDHAPQRARSTETSGLFDKQPNLYDTFENTYLKDFLNEVKEYNVKKGYRDFEDTQSNIVSGLKTSHKPVYEDIRTVLQEMEYEPEPIQAPLEETRVFSSADLNDDLDSVISSLDATRNMPRVNILDNLEEPKIEERDEDRLVENQDPILDDANFETLELSESSENELAIDNDSIETYSDDSVVGLDDLEEDVNESSSITTYRDLNDTFKRNLLEQTQTLQHKMIDQERHIEDMNEVMIRTNRLLHSVISILLLAIFVVIVLVVAQLVP